MKYVLYLLIRSRYVYIIDFLDFHKTTIFFHLINSHIYGLLVIDGVPVPWERLLKTYLKASIGLKGDEGLDFIHTRFGDPRGCPRVDIFFG